MFRTAKFAILAKAGKSDNGKTIRIQDLVISAALCLGLPLPPTFSLLAALDTQIRMLGRIFVPQCRGE